MKSHQFGFGTAVQSAMLLSADAGAAAYRQTFLANFNRATPENDLKWTEWDCGAGPGAAWPRLAAGRTAFAKCAGTNLVWPDWQYLPGFAARIRRQPQWSGGGDRKAHY
jgi:hypothetical protein